MATPPDAAPPSARVFNIMRFSTHDGPGIRTTVFFKGCPLACQWCHNPESQRSQSEVLYFEERCRHCLDCAAACPHHAISESGGVPITSAACHLCGVCTEACAAEARQIAGRRVTLPELVAEVKRDQVFFEESGGGVTLSGGEPLAQSRFVSSFLGACRREGIHTVLETCGYVYAETFRQVAYQADLVYFDLKLIDPTAHHQRTGVSNRLILHNLQGLAASGRPVTVRIPVIPGVNDSVDEIRHFTACLTDVGIRNVELLPYHRIGSEKYRRLGRTYTLGDIPQPAPEDLGRFRDALTHAGLHATIGGLS